VVIFNLISGDPTIEEPCRILDGYWLMIGLIIVMDKPEWGCSPTHGIFRRCPSDSASSTYVKKKMRIFQLGVSTVEFQFSSTLDQLFRHNGPHTVAQCAS